MAQDTVIRQSIILKSAANAGSNTDKIAVLTTANLLAFRTATQILAEVVTDGSITFAKIQDINSGTLLGRSTGGTGDVESITVSTGLTLSGGLLSVTNSIPTGTTNQTLRHNGTSWVANDILRTTTTGILISYGADITKNINISPDSSGNIDFIPVGDYIRLGNASKNVTTRIYNLSASTTFASSANDENIQLLNGNSTSNNWSGVSSYGASGNIDASVAFQHVNQSSNYADVVIWNRGAGGFVENLRVKSDRTITLPGYSSAIPRILTVGASGAVASVVNNANAIVYQHSSTGPKSDPNFFYDDVNRVLQLGGYSYANKIDVFGRGVFQLGSYTPSGSGINTLLDVQASPITTGINNFSLYSLLVSTQLINDGTPTNNNHYGVRSVVNSYTPTKIEVQAALNASGLNTSANVTQFYGVYGRIDELYGGGTDLFNRSALRFDMVKNDTESSLSHYGSGIQVNMNDYSATGRWKQGMAAVLGITNAKEAYGINLNVGNSKGTANTQTGIYLAMYGSGSGVTITEQYGMRISAYESSSATISFFRGIQLENVPTTASAVHFLYCSLSTAKSYHEGDFSIGTGSSSAKLHVLGSAMSIYTQNSSTTAAVVQVVPASGSFVGSAIQVLAIRAANSAFKLIDLRSNNVEQFSVNGAGSVNFLGALMPNNSAGTLGQKLISGGSGTYPTWSDDLRQFQANVTLPTTVGDAVSFVEITNGNFSVTIDIFATVGDGGFAVSKSYKLTAFYNQTANVWQKCLPLTTSGSYSSQDFEIDAKVSNATLTLRARRLLGSTAGTVQITVLLGGIITSTFTAVSASSSGAPTVIYGSTMISQLNNKVGIGTDTGLDAAFTIQSVGTNYIQRVNKGDGSWLFRNSWDGSNFHHYFSGPVYYNLAGNNLTFNGSNLDTAIIFGEGAYFYITNRSLGGSWPPSQFMTTGYATAGVPNTTCYFMQTKAWSWNGSNGYTIGSTFNFYAIQRSSTNYDGRLTIYNDTSQDLISLLSLDRRVGINTISPTASLHVVGDIYASLTGSYSGLTVRSFTTANNLVLHDGSGNFFSAGVSQLGVFMQNGNSFGAGAVLGTNDNNTLSFETNNTVRAIVKTTGAVNIVPVASTPGSLADGDIWIDSDYDKQYNRLGGVTREVFYEDQWRNPKNLFENVIFKGENGTLPAGWTQAGDATTLTTTMGASPLGNQTIHCGTGSSTSTNGYSIFRETTEHLYSTTNFVYRIGFYIDLVSLPNTGARTGSSIYIGLGGGTLDNNANPDDFVGFHIIENDATTARHGFIIRKNGTSTASYSAAITEFSNYYEIEWTASRVRFYLNKTLVLDETVMTNSPTGEQLRMFIKAVRPTSGSNFGITCACAGMTRVIYRVGQ